jgi:hypothetical protein
MNINYPTVYRLYIEHIGGGFYHGGTYYSIRRALQAIKMMHLAQFNDHLFWLHTIKNEQLIGKQRINLKF